MTEFESPAPVLDHIERVPLPWRNGWRTTECGKRAEDVASVIDHDAAKRKFTAQGQQRAAMSTCMTCANTANRHWFTWEASPADVLDRWLLSNRWGQNSSKPESVQINRELHAIAILIEAHRDEFDELVDGMGQAVSLADRRRTAKRGRAS